MLTQSEPHSLRIREGWFSIGASLVAQMVKNLPTMWETWVRSLGWKDPLEKGKAPHSSILAWREKGIRNSVCLCVCVCAQPARILRSY